MILHAFMAFKDPIKNSNVLSQHEHVRCTKKAMPRSLTKGLPLVDPVIATAILTN